MPTISRRRRRLVTTAILVALTAGALAAGAGVAEASQATAARRPLRAVTVQDPLDTGDASPTSARPRSRSARTGGL